MTPKQKVALGVSVVVLLAGAGYLYYEFVYKPKQKPEAKADEPAKTPGTATPPPPIPDKAGSQYGFKPGDILWAKAGLVNVYNYPEALSKYRVGFIQKQAQSQAKFISDAGAKGFVKANAVYFTPSGSQKKISDVYILSDQLTNVAP